VHLRAKGLGGGSCHASSCALELFARAFQPTASQTARQELGIDPPTPKFPLKIKHVDPIYPPSATAQGIQGLVMVSITVAANGRVTDARVVKSIPALDQAALAAVRQWEYDATLLRGPIAMTVMVAFPPVP
jgi:TonB family protein